MDTVKLHLQSKTIAGLAIILLLACAMALLGKLTPEVVDIIKWVGTSFMTVRLGANIGENFGNKPQ